MYFISKQLENTLLIAYHNHYVYSIGEKDGLLVIYRKCVFDAGEWDVFCKLNIKFSSKSKCSECKKCMPIAAGIVDSKLWIMAVGIINEDPKSFGPHVFSVAVDTKEVKIYATTSTTALNKYVQDICISCYLLQITFDNNIDGKPRFMISPLRPNASQIYSNATIIYRTPYWKQFYFVFNQNKQSCEFGFFKQIFMNSKSLYRIMYINGRLRFNLQRESLNGVEEDVTFIFEILDFFVSAPEQQIHIGFFRDQNNKFYCLTVNELGKKKHKIDQYKIGFNFVKQTARFYHQNTFFINEFLPEMQGFRIFIDSNILVFSSPRDGLIGTAVNRILTLSESAYMALRKLSEIVILESGLDMLEPSPPPNYDEKDGVYMSMKYLHNVGGIPKNVAIKHC